MRSEEWPQVEELLNAALELKLGERRKFLDEIGADSLQLRNEVESLLACEESADGFLAAPAIAFSRDFFDAQENVTARAGQAIGHYRIVREIGRGGMGAVFLAERADGAFEQQVALKVMSRSFADHELARRFLQERQILATLNHPYIARLIDGGLSADGELFLALEYVAGARIDDYCQRQHLSTGERLKLFLAVCQGVAYAHQHLVVHRDLKPSNILVASEGAPKLLDFGIAKLLDAEHASEHTQTNFRAFTPEYAAPEQINGGQITTASDVYSLGVLLENLLQGERPRPSSFADASTISSAATLPLADSSASSAASISPSSASIPPQKFDLWRTGDAKQKTKVANQQTNRRFKNRKSKIKHQTSLTSELANIIAMAKRDEPQRRYASVAQFAEDVQRYLDGLPVRAQKDSLTYRAEKFVRRHKASVAAAVLVALALIVGFAVALWQANMARQERDRAERRFNDVRKLSHSLLFEITPKIERLEGSIEARENLVVRASEYLDSLAQEAGNDLQLQGELAAAYEKVGDVQGAPRKPSLSDFNGAVASYEKAQTIWRRLLQKNPNDAESRRRLAANLTALGAIRWWTKDISGSLNDSSNALKLYDKLLAEHPDSLELHLAAAEARIDLANTYYYNSQMAEIYPPLQKALSELETLRETQPDNVEVLRLLARGRSTLGLTLSWDNKQTEGEAEMAQALTIGESLVAAHANDNVLKQELWATYFQGSQLYEEVNDPLSFQYMLKSLKVAEDAARNDAANTLARYDLTRTLTRLGVVSLHLKHYDEATAYLEKSLAIYNVSEKVEPKNRTYKIDIAQTLTYLGQAEYLQHHVSQSLAQYEKAAELYQNIIAFDRKNIHPRRQLAIIYAYLGDAHRDLAQTASGGEQQLIHKQDAKENYQRALDIFLQLQSENALAAYDHKYLEEVQSALRKYE